VNFTFYEQLLLSWIILAVIIFFILLRIPAPYGRHNHGKWGPMISNRWGWIIMEVTVLVSLWSMIYPHLEALSVVSWIIIGLFCLHYFNRTFIFPFRLRTRGKKMPLLVMVSGVLFNIVNGTSTGYFMAHFASYDISWLTDPRFIAGVILFFIGIYVNWRSDNILIHLRKPGQTHYVIPQHWYFRYLSCPNLFGELIEWAGFALLCWNLPALTFFIWTAANLIPRAISHHKWYQATFEDYPKDRKAVLPFLV
jgi:3-oxo-5-alpha-steroid 4-dehydrogenase 1